MCWPFGRYIILVHSTYILDMSDIQDQNGIELPDFAKPKLSYILVIYSHCFDGTRILHLDIED